MMLIEIAVEHKIIYIEQIKSKFFELFEKLEDRMALESKNNEAIKFNLILENQIRINRQTLHSQDVVGPMLKNLFEKGITENEIVAVKAQIDIPTYNSSQGIDITKTKNIKYKNFDNLFYNNNNSDWRTEYEKNKSSSLILSMIFGLITCNIEFLCSIDMLRNYPSISNYENYNNKKQGGIPDSII